MGSYLRPRSLGEALSALAAGPRVVLAGGTDHYPARATHTPDEDIVDLTALPGLRDITVQPDHLWIPCLATWTDVIEARLPRACDGLLDGLKTAARQVGGVQVQNAGTIVGNVCNASPAADGIPCLLALDAEMVLARAGGTRTIGIDAFVEGARRTARRPDELVLGVRIPLQGGGARVCCFEKLGARRYLVISIAMVAAVARLAPDGRILRAAVAVGSCSARAQRLPALERDLVGAPPHPARVTSAHVAGLAPLDDIRGTAAYRREAALELVRRAVAGLVPAASVAA